MSIRGTRRFRIYLDRESVVHDLGFLALRDVNETNFELELVSGGEPINCAGMTVLCRIIYNPRSTSKETHSWNGVATTSGVTFTMPLSAHDKIGFFALFVTVQDNEGNINTVFYSQGTLIEKETSTVHVPTTRFTLDELIEIVDQIQEMGVVDNVMMRKLTLRNTDDMDQVRDIGIYHVFASGQPAHFPTTKTSTVEIIKGRVNSLVQRVTTLDSAGSHTKTYVRYYHNDSETWTPWECINDDIAAVASKADGLERTVNTHSTDIGTLKTDVSGLKTNITGMQTDISGLKTNTTGMQTDISGLKTDVTGLKTDVAGMMTSFQDVGVEQAQQNIRLDALESRPMVDKSLTRRVANLEAAARGELFREETDSEAAHIKVVPPDAMPWALLGTIGGHSEVIGGEMMSFSPDTIVSRGANLYDEKKYPRTSGGIRWNTGVTYTSSTSLKTPYIPISDFRGMVLSYNSNTFSDVGGCAFYDEKQIYITGYEAVNNSVKTVVVPANASFLRFTQNLARDPNVMLSIGDSLPEYRPYREPVTLDLSTLVQKYFPGGMRSAGEVCDEIDFERGVAVQRVGGADLGRLTWTQSSGYFCTELPTAKGKFVNAVAARYTYGGMRTSLNDGQFGYYNETDNTTRLTIEDGRFATADDFKAGIAGEMFLYELAAPVETPIDPADLDGLTAISVEGDGTLTFVNAHGDDYRVPLPNQETFMIKLGGANA